MLYYSCNDKKSLKERMDNMTTLMQRQEGNGKYHNFYHKIGNEILHEQLMIRIAKYLIPSICKELKKLCDKGEIQIENINMLTSFIMYGQIGILSCEEIPMDEKIKQIRMLIDSILGM